MPNNSERRLKPALEVYFDDFKVTLGKGPVVQSDDYYPFGLRYNSFARENSVPNKTKLFQGQEHIDDLGLNWDSFKWRNHMPDIGRFFGVDKLAEKYYYNSPYAFSENKVTTHVELEGLEAEWIGAVAGAYFGAKMATKGSAIAPAASRFFSGSSGRIGKDANINIDKDIRTTAKIGSLGNDANIMLQGSKQVAKDVARDGANVSIEAGDKLQKGGMIVSAVGLPEVGVPMAGVGSVLQGAGTLVSAGLDISEGNNYKAVMDVATEVLDQASGNVLSKEMDAQGLTDQGKAIIETFIKEVPKEIGKAAVETKKDPGVEKKN